MNCEICGKNTFINWNGGNVTLCKGCHISNEGKLLVSKKNTKEASSGQISNKGWWQWYLFSFQGRVSRRHFWMFIVFSILYSYAAAIYAQFLFSALIEIAVLIKIVHWLYILLLTYIGIAVQVKRWHDTDRSGWWVLVNLVPIIGNIYALAVCGFIPSNLDDNQYGNNDI